MPETTHEHSLARGRRRGLITWGGKPITADTIVAVGTVITVVLTAMTLHNNLVTITVGIAGGGYVLVALAMSAVDPDLRRKRKLVSLARRIERGPPGLVEPLPQVKHSGRLIGDLARRLAENEWLCTVLLRGEDTLDAPPGIAEDAIPQANQCQAIVGAIGWEIEKAQVLGNNAKHVAADLRAVASYSLRESDPMETLRREVARTLKDWEVADRLVPLAGVRPESLHRPAGKWLLELFQDLRCTFGVFTQESGEQYRPQGPFQQRTNRRAALRYVSEVLSPRLPEEKVSAVFEPLWNAAGGDLHFNADLLRIRCAVIAVAAQLGEQDRPIDRLVSPRSPLPPGPDAREREAALELRWLVDRKAASIARGASGVFDRLAVIGLVTPGMFAELTRDLRLGAEGTEELHGWLGSGEFRFAGVTESTEDGIRLGKAVSNAALEWLRDGGQQAEYQDAQIAAERCYRVCLVLNRAHVPAHGYADLVAPGWGGLHLYEIPDWWKNVYAWRGHVAEISSPEHRRDAGVAVTCLFLETWWWWGDQIRLRFVDDVVGLAKAVLRDQPGWISALEDFDKNYVPELDLRAGAGDRWRKVAHALDFISGNLGLRRGEVPPDPVLARIYACWCFFSGDVAQQAEDLEAADGWFRHAAEAGGDDEDNAGMRAFASYQRADVWIPSDTGRSMRVIQETGLADAAVALEDLSLRAYVARMYGDIRWESGDIDGAFDAYGRALLLTYVYQVDQESETMPPSAYSYALYNEMRTRFLRRLGQAREQGREDEADAAIERIRNLFGPYWELTGTCAPSGEDPLAGTVPPLPDQAVLGTFDSGYARDALAMLHQKLQRQVADPVDLPLREPEGQSARQG